jgi:hypothetical protein
MDMTLIVVLDYRVVKSTTTVRMYVDIFEIHHIGHRVARWDWLFSRGWQNLLESIESGRVLCPTFLGELDGELDVHVAEIVMAV